ncbi:hypothetical protein GCM10010273_56700 [Streptomyces lavendulocolor]
MNRFGRVLLERGQVSISYGIPRVAVSWRWCAVEERTTGPGLVSREVAPLRRVVIYVTVD